jgi:hypothetical protein
VIPVGPVRVLRPELRGEVCTLIGIVCHGHVDGELHLPLVQLIRMLGLRARAELSAELDARGSLHFSGTTFKNHGGVIRRSVDVRGVELHLTIPEHLRGTILREYDRFTLTFEPGASLTGRAMMLGVELVRLEVNAERVLAKFNPGFELHVDLVGELPAVGDA